MQQTLMTLPVCLALVASGAAHAAGSRADALAVLEAQAAPRAPQVVFDGGDAPEVLQGCDLGTANDCFEPLGTIYLSVSAFFDSREPIDSNQYFLKLFQNETGDSLRLRGMGFYTLASSTAENRFQSAGAIIAGARLLFPESQALRDLLHVSIPGEALGTMTCVEFEEALDTKGNRMPAVLGPGDWAWAVLRFPELGPGKYVRIRVDNDGNDRPCDYLTPDGGAHWFRPDPRNGPAYDWGITVFTESKASRPEVHTEPTWTLVKTLYR